jgi:hypothetical protein
MPATQHTNGVVIDFAVEKGHGAASSKRACTNVRGQKSCLMSSCHGSKTEGLGDVFGLEWDTFVAMIVGSDGCRGWSFVVAKMDDTTDGGLDRACEFIATQTMSEDLAFGTVLLSCERVRNGIGSLDVVGRRKHGVKAAAANM